MSKPVTQTTEHDKEVSDVLADALAALTNEAMRHIAKISNDRVGVMLAVATLCTHRFEMVYRSDFADAMRDAKKKDEVKAATEYAETLVEQ
jgi:hypothetical protein